MYNFLAILHLPIASNANKVLFFVNFCVSIALTHKRIALDRNLVKPFQSTFCFSLPSIRILSKKKKTFIFLSFQFKYSKFEIERHTVVIISTEISFFPIPIFSVQCDQAQKRFMWHRNQKIFSSIPFSSSCVFFFSLTKPYIRVVIVNHTRILRAKSKRKSNMNIPNRIRALEIEEKKKIGTQCHK